MSEEGPIVTSPAGKAALKVLQDAEYVTTATIQDEIEYSRGHVLRVMGQLEDDGIVIVEQGFGRNNANGYIIDPDARRREILTRSEHRDRSEVPEIYTDPNSGYELFIDPTDRSKRISHHRLVSIAEHGVDEVAGKEIHHENGIPWDNRPENLTPMTKPDHISEHWHPTEVETVVANADPERLESALNDAGYSVDLES